MTWDWKVFLQDDGSGRTYLQWMFDAWAAMGKHLPGGKRAAAEHQGERCPHESPSQLRHCSGRNMEPP